MGKTLILTSPLEKGNNVKAFQRELIHAGYYHGPVDGIYGIITAQAVYRAKYWLGYRKPDHNAGDLLYGYLTSKKPTLTMKLLAKKRLATKKTDSLGIKGLNQARKFIGLTESPPDSNHQRFGVWYSADEVAWCAIFVTYCMVMAGSKAFIRGKRYAYVPNMVNDARAGRNNLSVAHPVRPGDIVTFDWPGESPGIADHTGFFVRWISKSVGTFETIEGNTSLGNNSNGGQVMNRKDRHINEVHTFIHVGK